MEAEVKFHEIVLLTGEKTICVSIKKGNVYAVRELNKDILEDLPGLRILVNELSDTI